MVLLVRPGDLMKKVYAILFDLEDNFLVARKRVLNRWWKGKTAEDVSIVDEANRFVFPSGEREATETFAMAARRALLEQTGYATSSVDLTYYYCDGFVLVCFCVDDISALLPEINQGLVKSRSNHAAPGNRKIKDWELAEVISVRGLKLPDYLGRERAWKDTEAGFYYPRDKGATESVQRYRAIVNTLLNPPDD